MANHPVQFTRRGRTDLRAIVLASAEEWGAERAIRYRRALETSCERLAEFPEMGRLLSRLSTERAFPSERHRIIYRERPGGIVVLRIVHQRIPLEHIELT